jgi:hypothetical protein
MGERRNLQNILVFWPTWVEEETERRNCKSPTLLTYYIGGKKKLHSANYIVSSHLSFLSGKI